MTLDALMLVVVQMFKIKTCYKVLSIDALRCEPSDLGNEKKNKQLGDE